MLDKEIILENLNSLHEHKMAKDIFVPVLKKMGCKGVKFTGGPDETGIDIEYYELTQPENLKSYVGVQFKKGNLVYSSGGSKNSVKEVKNQAEEAFDKEIHDIDDHATYFISRFVVGTTGDINEKARSFIGKARQKGNDRRIDYWTGDRLAEYIQDYWMSEFIDYFKIEETEEECTDEAIVDVEYIEENYSKLVSSCQKMRATVNSIEWNIIEEILNLMIESGGGSIPLADLLMELGHTEEYYSEEFRHLRELGYLYADESGFSLDGHASKLWELYDNISEELQDAEEDPEDAKDILQELIR
ncbi:hypothetical protein RDG65_002352 [Vibrio fluvialis]|uniref:hypothetical protein n=1 Tax=Vibrio fluvialis TaxID=676 RepID=UPI001F34CD99|nr:hypothetical protein [Vibrio fluvialis]EKO3372895.1 hypothetical protein [Vibrio fluvialis]ELE5027049.1 hypothetical protein [Vibrio fluvialis]MCE7610587.1 hypothetical protein [Vibrio fluvialis]MCE7621494.1 hypothetical protein [Vibrio fluvialis]MCE7630518.1 hypothetical protein [Vibrio fluvialis]